MSPSIYFFSEYSPEWPAAFEREANWWRALLGERLLDIHHIGSTSVPGLAAKPVIDLLPVVSDISIMDEMNERMEQNGYKAWGEYGLPGRRLFTKDNDLGHRTHNIHSYQAGNPEIDRHLAFCAYLRAHSDARAAYEALKRAVYARHPADIQAYNDAKNAWIKQTQALALEWYYGSIE